MKAVILAAGSGRRMGARTRDLPKCLLEIGGKPILAHQIEALGAAGVSDIIVVVGYLAALVESVIDGRHSVVVNERYASTNSAYSLWLCRERLEGAELLLLNADIVFDPSLLVDLLATKGTAALVDERIARAESNVVIEGGRIVRISDDLSAAESSGQSVQIAKFSAPDARLLLERIGALIDGGDVDRYPCDAYDAVFARSEMRPVFTRGRPWFEIDTSADLEAAERLFGERGADTEPREGPY